MFLPSLEIAKTWLYTVLGTLLELWAEDLNRQSPEVLSKMNCFLILHSVLNQSFVLSFQSIKIFVAKDTTNNSKNGRYALGIVAFKCKTFWKGKKFSCVNIIMRISVWGFFSEIFQEMSWTNFFLTQWHTFCNALLNVISSYSDILVSWEVYYYVCPTAESWKLPLIHPQLISPIRMQTLEFLIEIYIRWNRYLKSGSNWCSLLLKVKSANFLFSCSVLY